VYLNSTYYTICRLDDASNFDCEYEEERLSLISRTATNLSQTGTANGISRNLPFIGYTYVKERFTSDPVFTTGNDDLSLLRQRINELEAGQKSQSQVIAQLAF